MNTKVLEYIVAIAEEKSVSRAAERFYLSHPALSGHLKKLEQELGVPLFQRTSRGMQPTPAGLIFLADARAILHEEQKLREALTLMRHQRKNVIRMMVDTPFYNRMIQRVLPGFTAVHPHYTVDIVKCNAVQAKHELLQGNGTLGLLITTAPKAADLVYLPFHSGCLKLVFPQHYSGRKDIEGLREALASGMLLSMYPPETSVNRIVMQRLAAEQINPPNYLEGQGRNIIEHVRDGNTCSILPEIFLAEAERLGLTVGEEFCPIYHVLAYSSDTVLSPAVQDLMKFVIECFSNIGNPVSREKT